MSNKIKLTYGVGNSFSLKSANDKADYLNAALEAECYIKTRQIETADGIYWDTPEYGSSVNQTFFGGSAGILYFYTKLYSITKDESFLKVIEGATRYIALHWKDVAEENIFEIYGTAKGLYCGVAGLGLILLDVYETFKSEVSLKAVKEIVAYYDSLKTVTSTGIFWTGDSPLFLDGGITLFLSKVAKTLQDNTALTLAKRAADYFLSEGIRHGNGGLEINKVTSVDKRFEPNFEFGTAGSGFLFAQLYELTGDLRYLQAAKDTVTYLTSIAIKQEKGYLIPYNLTYQEPLYYLGSCHGPIGSAKLFYKLYEITGDIFYEEWIERFVDALEFYGAPEKQSAGYWNTLSYCCGAGGFVHFFIGMYLKTQNNRFKDLAIRSGNVLLGGKDSEKNYAHWPLAFTRIEPDVISSPIGYYDGAAGIAAVLLELYLLESGEFHWTRLADDPFQESLN